MFTFLHVGVIYAKTSLLDTKSHTVLQQCDHCRETLQVGKKIFDVSITCPITYLCSHVHVSLVALDTEYTPLTPLAIFMVFTSKIKSAGQFLPVKSSSEQLTSYVLWRVNMLPLTLSILIPQSTTDLRPSIAMQRHITQCGLRKL